ncbi:helix-turn-helix domain-containing protein [Streptomyces olivoreticuli]|uniref:helix-turn-helix domain-containing protein n=1 Tax=Streptomyces olivoreticuli TaxID=68246 RepID=UPI000E23D266|nr:helix-turn-helix domain-containing protein [Streptomyces olivoreticuli]
MKDVPKLPEDIPKTAADRAFRILRALDTLGPGAHSLDTLTRLTGLARSTAHRILQSAVREGAVLQSGYGRYRLAQSFATPADGPFPNLPLSLARVRFELAELRKRAGQASFLHVPVMLRPPLRVALSHDQEQGGDFETVMRSSDRAYLLFRAPLRADAAGLVLLAHLPGAFPADPVLERIRVLGHARTPSALAGWDLVAAPVRRGTVCVAAVSLLVRRPEEPGQRKREALEVMRAAVRLCGSSPAATPAPSSSMPSSSMPPLPEGDPTPVGASCHAR